jgi:peptidyl-prolyl cis-trans isomerase A (cyclophilin A)
VIAMLLVGLALAADPVAPPTYTVVMETTEGRVVVEVHRAWAPLAADRFHRLVTEGVYDGAPFFRVIRGFVAQFGLPLDPEIGATWRDARLPDDPVTQSNTRGRLSFATTGPGGRTTQVFVNLVDNPALDGHGFAPFASVVEGMDAVDDLYHRYGESPPRGRGPDQARLRAEGETYLRRFRKLDRIEKATVDGG